jgi:hypothetical protein
MSTLKQKEVVPVFKGDVSEDGKLYIKEREEFDTHLATQFAGQPVELTVRKPRKPRSRAEEKYYHAVVKKYVAEAMSIEDDEAHYFLRQLFLTVEETAERVVYEKTDKGYERKVELIRYERVMSTTELSRKEYDAFIKKCRDWASLPTEDTGLSQTSGLSTYIPEPNEVDYDGWAR